jgi:hypothetical protein
MTSLRAISTETGEERLVGESIGTHSGEVFQPTECVGTKLQQVQVEWLVTFPCVAN